MTYQEEPGFIGPRLPYHPKGGFDGPQKEDYPNVIHFLFARMAWTMQFMSDEECALAHAQACNPYHPKTNPALEASAKAMDLAAKEGFAWAKGPEG
jgi:hypothetical protein